MRAGKEEQRQRAVSRGLELAEGELLAAAAGQGAELEEVSVVLLLSDEDDFNALASALLEGALDGQVFRLPSQAPGAGAVAPYLGGRQLFRDDLTGIALDRRHRAGARIVTRAASDGVVVGSDLLCVIRPDGRLLPTLEGSAPTLDEGGVCVWLTEPRDPEAPAVCRVDTTGTSQ